MPVFSLTRTCSPEVMKAMQGKIVIRADRDRLKITLTTPFEIAIGQITLFRP